MGFGTRAMDPLIQGILEISLFYALTILLTLVQKALGP